MLRRTPQQARERFEDHLRGLARVQEAAAAVRTRSYARAALGGVPVPAPGEHGTLPQSVTCRRLLDWVDATSSPEED